MGRLAALSAVAVLCAGACVPIIESTGEPTDTLHVFVASRAASPDGGIHHFLLDAGSGTFTGGALSAQQATPMWLSWGDSDLLAAGASGTGAAQSDIVRYAVDRRSGLLKRYSVIASGGVGATYLTCNASTAALYIANYGDGTVVRAACPANAALGDATQVVKHEGSGTSERQKSPHPHATVIAPGGRFLLVPDLGTDRVYVYPLDPVSGALDGAGRHEIAFAPGSGPRHLVFTPDGRRLIVTLELTGEIHVLAWDGSAGTAEPLSRIALDPTEYTGKRSAAALAISPDGRFVYATNRGRNLIQVFALELSGTLREIQSTPSGGQTPWALSSDPSWRWLVVTNEGSGSVCAFAIDRLTGKVRLTGRCGLVPKPVALAIIPSSG